MVGEATVYNTRTVYDKGGGKILFYTNFENFDINDNIDTPLIGNSYEVLKESYITLQKKDYCLSFVNNDNSNQVNRSFLTLENKSHIHLAFHIIPQDTNNNFFWFSDYYEQSDFGFSVKLDSDCTKGFRTEILCKNSQPYTAFNVTLKAHEATFDWYEPDFDFDKTFIVDILSDENNRHVFLNGYKIITSAPKDKCYFRPSPRFNGIIDVFEIMAL